LAEDVNLSQAAEACAGCTGAETAAVAVATARAAFLTAVEQGQRPSISQDDLEQTARRMPRVATPELQARYREFGA
jgi:ATP-dependent 26S proteasome regulatory subunit